MSSFRCFAVILAMAFGLAACGEKPQTSGTRKADTQAWQANGSAHTVPGWTAGDKASWEEHLRIRAQGQNEHSRVR